MHYTKILKNKKKWLFFALSAARATTIVSMTVMIVTRICIKEKHMIHQNDLNIISD